MRLLVLNSVLLTLIFQACTSKIETIHPVMESITESVYASGIIKSKDQYQVYSSVNAVVTDIDRKEGELVQAGEVVIRLDNKTPSLNNSNAALAASFASRSANVERLKELDYSVTMARSTMESDELLKQRQEALWNQNIGTKNELEQSQLKFKASASAYHSAQLRYSQLLKQISFEAKQSQKNLEITSIIKDDYTVKSKVTGKLYRVLVKKGEMVNSQNPIAIIGDANKFVIELEVDEFDINSIKLGQKIVLSMDSYKDKVFIALVTKIDPIMNERSKSFTVEADFTEQPKVLYPFLSCEANIIIEERQQVMIIPRTYLLAGDSVMLEDGHRRKVITGLMDYQKVEVKSGISLSDILQKPRS